jgi:hypothetical protein
MIAGLNVREAADRVKFGKTALFQVVGDQCSSRKIAVQRRGERGLSSRQATLNHGFWGLFQLDLRRPAMIVVFSTYAPF